MRLNSVLSTVFISLFMGGFCMGQSLVPIDPASITDGHVYLLEDETDSSANGHTGNAQLGRTISIPRGQA